MTHRFPRSSSGKNLAARSVGAALSGITFGMTALGAQAAGASAAPVSTRPNFVFILSDDATWQAISAYGKNLPVKTPNLDRLAAKGVRFDRCTVGNSICSPSRASLLTGTHSHIHGVTDNYTPFNPSQPTYPALLRAAGYQTALIGKWHLHSLPADFDYFDILEGQGRYFDGQFVRNGGERYRVAGYSDRIITDKAVDWLQNTRKPDQPFLLNVHFKVPHRPFMAPPDMLARLGEVTFPEPATLFDDYRTRGSAARAAEMRLSRNYSARDLKLTDIPEPSGTEWTTWLAFHEKIRAQYKGLQPIAPEARVRWIYQRYMQDYMACIAALDREVGRILDTLDATGLAENTVVMFAGDQGFFLGEHGWFDKRFMYEESFRTAYLVYAPGVTRPGTATAALAQNIDWAPTILDLAGLRVPAIMQGRSLVPLLRGEPAPADWRTSLYYNYYEGPHCDHNVARHEGVATERYKLIYYYDLNEWEFYDLKSDPNELNNRYDDLAAAETISELKSELGRLRDEYKVPANRSIPEGQNRPMPTIGAYDVD